MQFDNFSGRRAIDDAKDNDGRGKLDACAFACTNRFQSFCCCSATGRLKWCVFMAEYCTMVKEELPTEVCTTVSQVVRVRKGTV